MNKKCPSSSRALRLQREIERCSSTTTRGIISETSLGLRKPQGPTYPRGYPRPKAKGEDEHEQLTAASFIGPFNKCLCLGDLPCPRASPPLWLFTIKTQRPRLQIAGWDLPQSCLYWGNPRNYSIRGNCSDKSILNHWDRPKRYKLENSIVPCQCYDEGELVLLVLVFLWFLLNFSSYWLMICQMQAW